MTVLNMFAKNKIIFRGLKTVFFGLGGICEINCVEFVFVV